MTKSTSPEVFDERFTIERTYDSTGNVITTVSEYDFGIDGIVDSREITTNVY